jgi:ATP-dependent Lon protease
MPHWAASTKEKVMKKVLLAVALISSIGVANAQYWQNNVQNMNSAPQRNYQPQNGYQTYTNQYGQVQGRAYTNGGGTTYTDQYGQVTGRAYTNGGTTTYTDQYGNVQGRVNRY